MGQSRSSGGAGFLLLSLLVCAGALGALARPLALQQPAAAAGRQLRATTVTVNVNATAISQSQQAAVVKINTVVADTMSGLCGKQITVDVAAEAIASACATATASVFASIGIDIMTSAGGAACASGQVIATSVANATARASARAIALAACCPGMEAVAEAAGTAVETMYAQAAINREWLGCCAVACYLRGVGTGPAGRRLALPTSAHSTPPLCPPPCLARLQ